ncbi:RNA polymerase factor sigma-54 [Microvirga sp. STS02]|uniref:RNA polymerase factor sigma-54 n=1 Tax=Hymenobacter negativus TaxID=2795026 RepID=UPI0018DBFCF1|nr:MULTISPECIES: RNA polymerase factor sigma-54 [Bacteria]MBH8570853.1 RNA polymerase factor sigma-54 [Hymenobacter negativus]MBR7210590.1 RNA polymerase factor sigma-54 [Microvirga sp. STS02]
MQRLDLKQLLSQKLSPQQIQFIKLLQIPTAELETRIKEEMEVNPALEEDEPDDAEELDRDDDDSDDDDPDASLDNDENTLDEDFDDRGSNDEETAEEMPEPDLAAKEDLASTDDSPDNTDLDLSDYLNDDEIAGYKMQGDGPGEEEERDTPLADTSGSLLDSLLDQLHFADLDERQEAIGQQLIGSIDGDGYIRRDLSAIANDLAFSQNLEVTVPEIEAVLRVVQQFDPPGIAARDLPECLLLQLERRPQDENTVNAERILTDTFEEFSKKHYPRIQQKLDLEDDELKEAINLILKLNPKPGGSGPSGLGKTQYLMPDFILTNDNGVFNLTLNARNAPELRVSPAYTEMFRTYDKAAKKDTKMKEAVTFVKQKLDSAKWFIDAIRQRQNTLLRTMNAIVELQRDFFAEGDEGKLKPMILKDIATRIGMDISTVSRVANSKSIQTEFGIYPLKYFFSEGIATDSGEDASSREVKSILKDLIGKESKERPLSDDKLEKMLNARGYNIARRTVAKYREQLNIPVARLRKEL